jgi:hypothetical protein
MGQGRGNAIWQRPFDPVRDRLVLTTSSQSSSTLKHAAKALLDRFRETHGAVEVQAVASNAHERTVATKLVHCARRAWSRDAGIEPSDEQLALLFRGMHIQLLDLDDNQTASDQARDTLSTQLLQRPAEAGMAWSVLVELASQHHERRTEFTAISLAGQLRQRGVALQSPPDYRAAIQALQQLTESSLIDARRFCELIPGDANTVIERDIAEPLRTAVQEGHLLVVGEPGSGKSGLLYRLARTLATEGASVVFLSVDGIAATTSVDLSRELRLGDQHDLSEVLLNWFDTERGYLILDALDAARSGATQALLRKQVIDIMRQQSHWTVIASVREFDLRHGAEWQQAFRGQAPEILGSEEFTDVRHAYVRRLSDPELDRAAETLPRLAQVLAGAPYRLRELLRNIFNLHLIAELVGDAELTDLQTIRYQVELLDRYWRRRLHSDTARRDAREQALDAVLACMITDRALRAERQDVRRKLPSADLSDLERIGILRSPTARRAQAGEVLVFAHHILFDYTVARLAFRRGRIPNVIVQMLSAEPDLALLLGPGMALCLDDAWLEQSPERSGFWELAFALAAAEGVPEIAKVQAPMTVATDATSIEDLMPLLRLVDESTEGPVDRFLWHLAAALAVRIAAGAPLVGEYGGPWAAFADHLSKHAAARSRIYALRNIVRKLTERRENLTVEQLCHSGRAARRLLEAAWARQYDRGLVATGLDAVCDTYESDREGSAALIRRALQPEHIRRHGFEEMPRIAHHIGRIIDEDPALAVEIYRTAFGYDEESIEENPLGSGLLLGLISNRRQDYRLTWWALAQRFPKFLETTPVHATRALLGTLEGYITRKDGLNVEHARTIHLKLGEVTARLRQDHSCVWASRDFEPHDDAQRMLIAFSAHLRALADKVDAEGVFREILTTVVADNELAVVWAALIHAAADAPQAFAASLVELVSATSVLTWPDTAHAAARYLESAYPTLSSADRAALERAIVALPHTSESERHVRLTLVGYLPPKSIVTDEASELRREAEGANAARKNQPLFRSITSWRGSRPSLSEQLERDGVDTRVPANQHLIGLIEPIRTFSLEHLDGKFDLGEFRALLPALHALHNGILKACATREILDDALNYLAAAVANAARVEAIANDDGIAEFLRAILLLAARGRGPDYDSDSEAQFARSPGWSGPNARIEAGQGLMDFLCWRRQEFDSLRPIVDELACDPVAAVRFQIAKRILYFYQDQPDWVVEKIRYFILEDANTSVVHEALIAAHRAGAPTIEDTCALATVVVERFWEPTHEGEERCRDDAVKIVADLHVWDGNENATDWLEKFLNAPATRASTIRDLVTHYRDTVVYGAADQPDSHAEAIRSRVLQLYRRMVERSNQVAQTLWRFLQSLPVEQQPEADREALREKFKTLDHVATELYFASGAYDPNSKGGRRPGPVHQRLFVEAHDILDGLSDVPVPHTSHQLIETLEFLIECDPAEVFRLIATAIRSSEAQGYTAEPMAVDLFARVIERYLADFREIFDDGNRRAELLACLDAFVRQGSPKARQLTYRIPEIWQ